MLLVCGLLVQVRDALAKPKLGIRLAAFPCRHKQKAVNNLGEYLAHPSPPQGKPGKNLKCRTMHIHCTGMPDQKQKARGQRRGHLKNL